MALIIRRIGAGDAEGLREIRLRALQDSPFAFGSTYAAEVARPIEHWQERAARGAEGDRSVTFVAERDRTLVGLVGGVCPDGGGPPELVSMWVAPGERGTGVGEQLVTAVLDWARGRGAHVVDLWVTNDNDRARGLYERMGFEITTEHAPVPSDPCREQTRMRWSG